MVTSERPRARASLKHRTRRRIKDNCRAVSAWCWLKLPGRDTAAQWQAMAALGIRRLLTKQQPDTTHRGAAVAAIRDALDRATQTRLLPIFRQLP